MAHKKGQGSSRNGRDSKGQHRGVKVFGGQSIRTGGILVRQCGTKIHPGMNVGLGRDYTIFSLVDGVVAYDNLGKGKTYASVIPAEEIAAEAAEDGAAE